jgi:hypothetical protein
MANIMKTAIQTILVLFIFCSCGQQTGQKEQFINSTVNSQTDTNQTDSKSIVQPDKKVGEQLFKEILDTIKIEAITNAFLLKNQWAYKPFDNCSSFLKFKANGKGLSYNCEMEEEYEMTYQVIENRVYIAEYDIPHVDNEEQKKIKFRDDIYVYNGHSLIMIGSKMYNIGGLEWTPKIEDVINYDRKKY